MRRLIIVDDDPQVLEVILDLISSFGFRSVGAKSFDSIILLPDDVVIYDLSAARNIKFKPKSGVKYLTMTGNYEYSADIHKPFDPLKFLQILNDVCPWAKV